MHRGADAALAASRLHHRIHRRDAGTGRITRLLVPYGGFGACHLYCCTETAHLLICNVCCARLPRASCSCRLFPCFRSTSKLFSA